MAETKTLRAGVVGLGMIGGGVAVSMARRGRVPAVHDVRPNASAGLPGVGDPLGSPAEVARSSDVVMVAVVTADQARDVIGGENGLLAGAHPGLTIVLLSTVALPVVHELAALCAGHDVGFLDCGVTPGDRAADHGLVAIVGGEEACVEAARPVLDDWARRVVHCGPLGAGMATKIARNVVTYGSWRAVFEATALAHAAGVNPARLAEVIDTADPEGHTLLALLRLRDGGDTLPEAAGRKIQPLMTKDLDAAHDLAATLNVDVPLVEAARTHADQTLDQHNQIDQHDRGDRGDRDAAVSGDGLHRYGLEIMDRVYGPGFSAGMQDARDPFTDQTVDYLFAQVWARPGLSVRDRRLLTLGVAATVGRPELVQIIATGGLVNDELTPDQLREAVLHLAAYTGWCKATATHAGVTAAIETHTTAKANGAAEARPAAEANGAAKANNTKEQ
ncbi:NAD(P)-binding domain-containing protein [Frankia sp. AiPs1]|uniref:NAD(P)-binding domain-containing protein n=1 Tax=Frankia sp. AiPs1 TaxID=573493 RepID=UPI00255ACE5F|nr:NAD(P)-binding domain-containing protein [Frankia sp. AiPs1]